MKEPEQPGDIVRPEAAAGQLGPHDPGRHPRVSVIVLNFNGENIIARCLDHLLAQTYRDFEILVVDNNSSDAGVAVAQRYLGCGRLSIIRAARNLGVAGGRNLGLLHVHGEVIAFIDNDGYAHPDWLAEAVATLDSGPDIGAVAPLVFLQRNKALLNGAGGMMNRQGYAHDVCFGEPYEFAHLRVRVVYPMGCGMVIRREVFDKFGPFDATCTYYFDDAELGVRIWRAGLQVALSPRAWVDHEYNYSGRFFTNRALLFERSRVRTVLKHYPLRRLAVWLFKEGVLMTQLDRHIRIILLRAWLWNLVHLPSALSARLKFAFAHNPLWELLEPSWGQFPSQAPNNMSNRPDLTRARPVLVMDGKSDVHQLNFGWYQVDRTDGAVFRRSAAQASALFRLPKPALSCSVDFRTAAAQQHTRLVVRRLGQLQPVAQGVLAAPGTGWQRQRLPMHLPAGNYELLLLCGNGSSDGAETDGALAVSSIAFE
jgi:GT2 family glycosyltransferase